MNFLVRKGRQSRTNFFTTRIRAHFEVRWFGLVRNKPSATPTDVARARTRDASDSNDEEYYVGPKKKNIGKKSRARNKEEVKKKKWAKSLWRDKQEGEEGKRAAKSLRRAKAGEEEKRKKSGKIYWARWAGEKKKIKKRPNHLSALRTRGGREIGKISWAREAGEEQKKKFWRTLCKISEIVKSASSRESTYK